MENGSPFKRAGVKDTKLTVVDIKNGFTIDKREQHVSSLSMLV